MNSLTNPSSNEFLGSTSKHLFHFVHVTDIHLTHFGKIDRAEQFEKFCNENIKSLIKPQVTVITGDLTHNRDPTFGSEQYEQEWMMYKNLLNRTNIAQYTAWLDMRGNHDAFMDPDPVSNKSFYRIYSNQGPLHTGSYQYTLTTSDNDTYSFVGIDMCPRPGAGRPFNFLGQIDKEEMKNLKSLSEQTRNSNTTIFFGHYPLSFTYSSGLEEIMRHGLAYLNGHLHTLLRHLYTRHSNGLIELELADWKDSRQFRIITIDSGLLSFEDFHFNQPIYAVISNPKAEKIKTWREPLYRLSQSSHIRILIFSKSPIVDVRVSIDSKFLGNAIQSIDNQNLYVLQWNSNFYNDGHSHNLVIEIKDQQNNKVKVENDFSLSTKTSTHWTLSKLLLFLHWPTIGMVSLVLTLILYILILIFYRCRAKRMISCWGICFNLWNKIRLRMMLLCSVDLFFYSLIGLALYHFIGPWYIGYLTDGYFGAIFLWGTVIRGIYLRPDMQIFMGTIQLILFLFPLTLCLSSSCYYRFTQLQSSVNLIESCFDRFMRIFTIYIILVYTILFVLFWSYVTTASYHIGWIISPFGLTLAACSILLFIKSKRLEIKDFKLQSTTNNLEYSINQNIDENEQQTIITGRTIGVKNK